MINLLLGAPGGGKSYEAVAYHVLPALLEGRKVITNLPLILDAFPPELRKLIDLRVSTRKPKPEVDWKKAEGLFRRFGFAHKEPKHNPFAFANIEDYGVPTPHPEIEGVTLYLDPWRHPETGTGPLYVIDECHKPLRSVGTPVAVEEWFAEHRHGFCDVLLMTQSHGKINKAIKELVQVCYRVRKATHLGFDKKYIRKVLDGVGGTEMNESVREYDPSFFKYYKSHTQSSSAGKELQAKDIVPIWKHWSFKGAALCLVLGAVGMYYAGNPLKPKQLEAKSKPIQTAQAAAPAARTEEHGKVPVPDTGSPSVVQANQVTVKASTAHPLAGSGLHIGGHLTMRGRSMYLFSVSQNGQLVYTMNEEELAAAGYSFERLNDCMAKVTFEEASFYITCDAPRIGVNPGANITRKTS